MALYNLKKIKQNAQKTIDNIRAQLAEQKTDTTKMTAINGIYVDIDDTKINEFVSATDIEHIDYVIEGVESRINKLEKLLAALKKHKSELETEYGYDTHNA